MPVDFAAVIAYAIGLLLLFIVGKILIFPIKILLRLLINGIIGGIILLLINAIGGFIGLGIAINAVTALIVGFLGIPGVILLLILRYIAR